MRAGNFENDPYKIIKGTWVLSVREWQQLMSTTKKYQLKSKKLKKKKGSSQIIKIVLVMLTSGVLLSEKQHKTYQLRLWFFFTPKRYDKHLYPFPIAFSPPMSTKKPVEKET